MSDPTEQQVAAAARAIWDCSFDPSESASEDWEAYIPHARAALRAAAPRQPEGWMDIETAPKGVSVLVSRPPHPFYPRVSVDKFTNVGIDMCWAHSHRDHQPTHWQPLPEPAGVGETPDQERKP